MVPTAPKKKTCTCSIEMRCVGYLAGRNRGRSGEKGYQNHAHSAQKKIVFTNHACSRASLACLLDTCTILRILLSLSPFSSTLPSSNTQKLSRPSFFVSFSLLIVPIQRSKSRVAKTPQMQPTNRQPVHVMHFLLPVSTALQPSSRESRLLATRYLHCHTLSIMAPASRQTTVLAIHCR